jgi:hypothetical protein
MELLSLIISTAPALLLALAVYRVFRGRTPGAGATGAVYDLLNEDKRRSVEIIAEQRAEEVDPETRDGNLPDLVGRSREQAPRMPKACRD